VGIIVGSHRESIEHAVEGIQPALARRTAPAGGGLTQARSQPSVNTVPTDSSRQSEELRYDIVDERDMRQAHRQVAVYRETRTETDNSKVVRLYVCANPHTAPAGAKIRYNGPRP
jgi:hypothetical protein